MTAFHAVAEFAVGEHAPSLTCASAAFSVAEKPAGDVLQSDAASFMLSGQVAEQAWPVGVAAFSLDASAAFVESRQHEVAAFALFGRNTSYSYSTGYDPIDGAIAEYAVAEFPFATAVSDKVDAESAAFALVGQHIGAVLQIDAGNYALAGEAAFVTTAAVDPGAYTLDGGTALASGATPLDLAAYSLFPRVTTYHYAIPHSPTEGAVAEYAWTEFPALDLYGLAGRPAAFAVAGPAITLPSSIVANNGDIVLSGGEAHIAVPHEHGSFVFDGGSIITSYVAPSDAASFTLYGAAAEQAWPANVAAYLLSSQDITTAITLPADPASIIVSSPDALLLPGQVFYPDAASFILAGIDAAFTSGMSIGYGAFALSGNAVDIARFYPANSATFTLTGQSILWRIAFGVAAGQFTLLGWSIADAIGPSGDHVYLVEVQAHNGSSVVTFYLSTEGYTSQAADTPSNQTYIPRIVDPGNFQRTLFSGDETRGRSSVGVGDIIVASGDPGNGDLIDEWLDYGWSGRNVTVKALPTGAKSISAGATLFRGKLDKIISTNPLEQFELRIADRLSDLDKPLLTSQYAGTTVASAATAEGNADLKGQIKQQIWGECHNVRVQPANVYDLIYVVSNSALQSIDAIYDGGLALTIDGDNVSIASLQAASISAGHARTCKAAGLIRLGGTPTYEVTVDAKEGADAAARTAAQIAKRMLIHMGETSATYIDGAFTNLDVKNNAVCGIVIADDRSALDAIQEVLDSIGAWMAPNRDGAMVVSRFEAPAVTPALTFDLEKQALSDSFSRSDSPVPVWRVNLQYDRLGIVQDDSALAGAVAADRRAYLATEYRKVSAEDASIKTKHLNAGELTITTCLTSQSDAQDEADRLLALHGTERERYEVSFMLSDAWAAEPGNQVTFIHSRLGMSGGGKPFAVLGRVDQYADERVALSVWG